MFCLPHFYIIDFFDKWQNLLEQILLVSKHWSKCTRILLLHFLWSHYVEWNRQCIYATMNEHTYSILINNYVFFSVYRLEESDRKLQETQRVNKRWAARVYDRSCAQVFWSEVCEHRCSTGVPREEVER